LRSPDAARRAATEADAARSRGDDLGPLHGLPITVKDSFETAGMRTVCGRPDLADHVPTQDAEAVARLRRSGAIIVGKTNMPTGNADVQASNPVFGRTNNPWDGSRTSGGSAGGGAAATAAGLTSFDYGSEIGGSTRIPAHFCGLYGHKSTWQSVPLVGHIPGGPGNPGRWGEADMACAGVQARGARDIIPALEATVGPLNPDGGFSYTLAPPRATVLKDFRIAPLELPRGVAQAFPRQAAKQILDNDRVLVWDFTWAKGMKTDVHFHGKDVVVVYLGSGTVRSIPLTGEPTAVPRSSGLPEMLYNFSTSGKISSSRNRTYWSLNVSYSKLRFSAVDRASRPSGNSVRLYPGSMNTPMVTGISFAAIRLSKTIGTRKSPSSLR
jgi:hypothetical protein